MRLITETVHGMETLVENTSKGKSVYITGPFLMANRKNRNGRVYPKEVMQEAVDRYKNEYINERRAIGELNHPERPFPDPRMAAIMIESLDWQGDNVIGKAKVLNTPDGLIIKELLENNFKLGVSSRGLGDLKQQGDTTMVNRFLMNAIDAVDLPSGQVCYVDKVHEGVEWIQENGIWLQKNLETKEIVTLDKVMEGLEQLFAGFKRR